VPDVILTAGGTPAIDNQKRVDQIARNDLSLAQFAATTSAQLESTISDSVGSGALRFGSSAWFVNLTPGAELRATIGGTVDATEGEEVLQLHQVMLRTIKFIGSGTFVHHGSFQFALPEDYDGGTIDLDVYFYKESGTSTDNFVFRIAAFAIVAGDDLGAIVNDQNLKEVTPPTAAEEVFIETYTMTPPSGSGAGTMMSGIVSRRPGDAEDVLSDSIHVILIKAHQ